MKLLPRLPGRFLLAGILLVSHSFAQERSLRFFGNGYQSPGTDRVKIPLDGSSPVNVSGDFTIECWLKCDGNDNKGNVSPADHGDGWITGNVFIDRDVYGNADPGDFGFSIGTPPGLPPQVKVVAFGINRKGTGITILGKTQVGDNKWHHIALTRNANTGTIRLFIDGKPDAEGTGPAGEINYLSGRHTSYPESDPFLVIGAEKHDGGAAYPAFNGFMDELRVSSSVRYENIFTPQNTPFIPDETTAALYHFDEGNGSIVKDHSENHSSSSDGFILEGGNPAGPVWQEDSPFMEAVDPMIPVLHAQKSGYNVQLTWETATSATAIEIQRSRDGKNFNIIERIHKQKGCSNCGSRYSDTNPYEGKNYYRIRVTGPGKESYSPLVTVSNNIKTEPYRLSQEGQSLVIRNNSTIKSIVIWNSEGKRVAEKKMLSQGTTRLPLGNSRGMAFVHITLDDGTRFTEKLLLR